MPVIYSWGNARWVDPRFPLINLLSCRLKPHFPDKLLLQWSRAYQASAPGHVRFGGIFWQVVEGQLLLRAECSFWQVGEEAHSRGGYQTPGWQRTFVFCTSRSEVSYSHSIHPAHSPLISRDAEN